MNVIDYAKKYGSLTFDKEPITEADKLLFSLLSYVPYSGTVSESSKNKRTIHDVAEDYFKLKTKKENRRNILAIRSGIKILNLIKDMPRYKDLLLYNDCYIGDESQQFSAVCIDIKPGLVFVSFEGTDQLVSGWEEDFEMAYKFPVPAQTLSIKYLNKHFTFKNCKIIIGGHSKGGNLALVSAMYSNFLVRNKIKEIYSFDGPGLMFEQLNSKKFKRVEDRLYHVVPHNSLIGISLPHQEKIIAIKSNGAGLLGHFAENWQFDDMNFKRVKLSKASKLTDENLNKWLEKYSTSEKELFVNKLFSMFKDNDVTDVLQILDRPKVLLKMLKDAKNIDDKSREMIKDIIDILIDYSKQSILSIIKR